MNTLLAVALGGAAGALSRYGTAAAVQRLAGTIFPWGTMAVNLAGAFLIGFLTFLFSRTMVSPELRMGLLVGFLGSYTTFSTYMLESVSLLQDGEYGAAAGNLIFGNLAGLVAVVGGMWAARLLVAGLRGGGW